MKRLITFILIFAFLILAVAVVRGESNKDIRAIKKKILKNSGDAIPYLQMGHTLLKSGQYQEATIPLTKANELEPNFAEAHYSPGIANGALGKHLEKIKVFDETTRIQPSFAGGHFKLGVAHTTLERHQEAGESYKLALKIDIDYPLAHYFMALS